MGELDARQPRCRWPALSVQSAWRQEQERRRRGEAAEAAQPLLGRDA